VAWSVERTSWGRAKLRSIVLAGFFETHVTAGLNRRALRAEHSTYLIDTEECERGNPPRTRPSRNRNWMNLLGEHLRTVYRPIVEGRQWP
jgi:hypothetical protein